MKYDDWSWHAGGDFPADLPSEAAGTHIGMFVACALLHGLAGAIHTREFPEPLARLRERSITPGAFFLDACDGKFVDEDLSDIGNRFAEHYYQPGTYFRDYAETVGLDGSSVYHTADTWHAYERLDPVIQQRFDQWRTTNET